MTRNGFQQELERFDPRVSIDEAWTPPASWYTQAEFLEREREQLFRRTWQFACATDQVAETGHFVRLDLAGESYVVVRDGAGDLRAYHNVCRHHAAELVEGEGCLQRFVCPYHGWTYELDGRLTSAPRMGGMKSFDRNHFSLQPVQVETWGPFVFVHAGKPQRSAREVLSVLEDALDPSDLEGLAWVARRRYPMACNWKVFVDNYLDGGYHIAHLHKGLDSQIDMGSYHTEVREEASVQLVGGRADATDARGNDFRERIGDGAVYAWLHPNFMINRYGPILDTNWVVPTGPESCEVVFDYWFPKDGIAEREAFIEKSLRASDDVQQEDVWISEAVQRGLGSRVYDRGRYAPAVEIAMHHFHRLLARDLRAE